MTQPNPADSNLTEELKTNVSPFYAWILAARPKTLAASTVPVIVGSVLAFHDGGFQTVPAILSLFFALWAQIGANFINDWSDFRKGADTNDRLGPNRMVALGVISPRKMFFGALFAFGIACLFGLGLIWFGGVWLIAVGAVCVLFAMLYSAGPLPLAYCGLGDLLVVLFFGVVAVTLTYFVQTGTCTTEAVLAGLAVGFATDNILIANNYRDRAEDRKNRKFTLVAIFGERFGRYFYLTSGLLTSALFLWTGHSLGGRSLFWLLLPPALWLALHLRTWRRLSAIREGAALNEILERSAKNLFAFAVLFALEVVRF